MAVEKFWNAGIFYNGWNLTGQTNKVSLTRKMSALDTSVFGVTTRIFAPGQAEMDASVSGWWYTDQTAGSSAPDPALFNYMGTYGAPLLLYPDNSEDGGTAFAFPATQGSFNFFGAFGELAPFSADFHFALNTSSTDRVQPFRGYLAVPFQTVAGAALTGNYVQIPVAVTSAQYLVMCVHVVDTDGSGVVAILESDDNSGFATPTTRLTSSSLTDGTAWMDDVAGPIATDTYYRIKLTRTGGTTTTAVAAFGVA